ncbi:MAG: VanZ family protein [Coriobacteriia bacterium]|nr:VanZ family protein [Coriobacteriia bacterium]
MSKRVSRPILWFFTVAWAGGIYAASSLPGSIIPGGYSEVGHLGEYAVLGILLSLALRVDRRVGVAFGLAVLLASLYGAADEFHQQFVFMRTPDMSDWALDTVGAFGGATLTWLFGRGRAKRRAAEISAEMR